MKKRQKRLMALTVLFVFITTLIPVTAGASVAIGTSYYDIDLEANSGDGVWGNKASSGMYFGYQSSPSLSSPVQTLVDDPYLGTKAMKLVVPKGDARHEFYVGGYNISPAIDFSSNVAWYEMSFRFEKEVTGFRLEGNSAIDEYFNTILLVKADGEIKIGGDATNPVWNVNIVPDKWYHFVIAVDNIDKANSKSKIYAWANGTLLQTYESFDYTVSVDANKTASATRCAFHMFRTPTTDSTMYVDNFKCYTTTNSVAASGYAPATAPKLSTSENVEVDGNSIKVAAGTKLSEIDAAVKAAGLIATYWNGETKITNLDGTKADGVKVRVSNGLMYAEYVVVEKKGEVYYDIDLEANSGDGVWGNKASSGMYFGYQSSPSLASPVQTLVDDPYLGTKAMKLVVPKGDARHEFYVGGYNISPAIDFSSNVAWYEMSFRFEKEVTGFRLEGNSAIDEYFNTILLVKADGEIKIGGDATNPVWNVNIVPDKWYHFVIAVDNIDKANSKSKIYAWANGTLLQTYESFDYTVSVDANKTASATRCAFHMFRTPTTDSTMYVDNFKCYTTTNSVVASGYTPATAPKLSTSDNVEVDGSSIKVAAGTKLSEIDAAVKAAGLIATYWNGETKITDLSGTKAAGVTVRLSNGFMYAEYVVVEKKGEVYYDIDLEANSGDGVWGNKASSGMYFGYQSSPSLASPVQTLVDDPYLGTKAMKLVVPKGDARHEFYVGGYNISPAIDFSSNVAWYEMSFRFEKEVTGFRLEGNSAIDEYFNTILLVKADGEIKIGGDATNPVWNVNIVPDKWYHFVIAVDNIDKANSKSKIYAWANGTLLQTYESFDYTVSVDANKTASATRCAFHMFRTPTTDSTMYVDNFKCYTTTNSVVASGYTPVTAPKLSTSESVEVEGSTIKVAAGTKLSTIDAAVKAAGLIATYWNGRTKITDLNRKNIDNLKVRLSNGFMYAEYVVEEKVGKIYYDIDLEANSGDGVWANKAASGMYFGYQSSPSLSSPVQTLVDDPYLGTKAMKLVVPKGDARHEFYVGGYNISPAIDFSNSVAWYEMSFRFENEVTGFRLEGNSATNEYFNTILLVKADGEIKIGGDATNPVWNMKVEPDKWYHFVIAVDNIDKVNSKTRIYAWANGTLLQNYESFDYTLSVDANNTASATRCAFHMFRTPTTDSTMYVDNFKCYTTTNSVAASGYAPATAPKLSTSDNVEVDGSSIKVAAGTKLSEIDAAVKAAGLIATYWNGGTKIDDLDGTNAIGKKVCLSNGLMLSEYTIIEKGTIFYYDIDYNNGNETNKAGTSTFVTVDGGANISYPLDAVKGNNVKQIDCVTEGRIELLRGNVGISGADAADQTIWYELSFKHNNAIDRFFMSNDNFCVFEVYKNKLYLGAAGSTDNFGTPLAADATIENDTWYNVKVAIDFNDKKVVGEKEYAKIYAWLNGELIKISGDEEKYTMLWETETLGAKDEVPSIGLWVCPKEDITAKFFMDDFKVYTKETPVCNAEGDYNSNPAIEFATITSESAAIIGNVIYTTGIEASGLNVAGGKLVNVTGSTVEGTTVLSVGDKVYLVSDNGVGAVEYTVAAPVYKATEYLTNVKYGKKADVTLVNATAEDKTADVIFTTYGPEGVLIDSEIVKNVTIAAGTQVKVYSNEALDKTGATIGRVFVWESIANLKPALANLDKSLTSEDLPMPEPPLGDTDVSIDTTDLNPDLSAFIEVPESISVQERPAEVITDYTKTKSTYEDCICVVANSSNVWLKNGKYNSDYKFVWDGNHIIGAAPTLAAFANQEYIYDKAAQTATIGNVIAKAGDKYIVVDGKKYESDSENQVIDGVLYLPLREFVRYGMNKFYGESVKGFGVIATRERPYHFNTNQGGQMLMSNDDYSMMMAYLVLDRYNAASLMELFNKNIKGTPYPRILTIKEDAPKYIEAIKTDEFMAEMSGYVMEQANEYLNQNISITAEKGQNITGLPSLSMPEIMYYAYCMTGDSSYINKAINYAIRIASLKTWNADSHMLSTSACCIYLAYVYDLYYDELSKYQKLLIANALIAKGIQPHLDYMYGVIKNNKWPYADYNWNLICNVGPMVASMALLGEGYNDATLLDCIEKAQVSLGYSLHYFAPDGHGWESPGYTNYTLSYMTILFEGVCNYFGESLGVMGYPGLEGIGTSMAKTTGKNNNWTIHCEDTPVPYNTAQNMFFTKLFEDYEGQRLNIEQNYKYPAAMKLNAYTAMKNYLPNPPEVVDYPEELDFLYTSSQIGMSRDAWGAKTQAVMGVHGGYNLDAGLQVDIGNFFYEFNGQVFADDPGIENYALPITAYPCRAEGANVWVVNPDASYGQNLAGYGDLSMVESNPKGVIYTLDLSSAYYEQIEAAQRGYMLADNRKVFTVQDEIKPFEGQNEFYWFWHTSADIEINQDNKSAVLTLNGETCTVYFDSNVDFTISKQDTLTSLPNSPEVPGQNQMPHAAKQHKIVVQFYSEGEPITFRAMAVPYGQTYTRGDIKPISEWTIPD